MKLCLFAMAFLLAFQPLRAQKITHSAGSISVNIPGSERVVHHDSSAAPTGHDWHVWIEPGDGNYLTYAPAGWSRPVTGVKLNHPPYLRATLLYDTSRRPPSGASAVLAKQVTGTAAPIEAPQLGNQQIKLFSSERKMVDNDTMVFGISYRTQAQGTLRLILKYNSGGNQVFTPLADPAQAHSIYDYDVNTAKSVAAIRTHAGETAAAAASGAEYISGFGNGIVFSNITASSLPRNLFVTLVPEGITTSDSTMIVAELQRMGDGAKKWATVQSDTIMNMRGDASHDPNDISVSPVCLKLPQKVNTLHYHINFQNLGGGNAKAVKVVFFAPPQMNWAKKIWNIRASFSEQTNLNITDIEYDEAGKKIIFTFPETLGLLLEGTKFATDPAINPLTMGHIEFDVEVTPGADVNAKTPISALADIYFLSVFPSPNVVTAAMVSAGTAPAGTAGYEVAVRTNPAISGYLDSCNPRPSKCDCKNPQGLWCWICCYWWALAIIILLIFVLWLLRRRRRP